MISLKKKKILIIAPHPDDEIIGCGGLIARAKREGGRIYILYLTVGDAQDFSKKGYSGQSERITEIKNTAQFLKFDGWRLAFPGNDYHLKLDHLPQKDLIHQIERGPKISLQKIKPDIIISPQPEDFNQDHRAASQAMITATRPAHPKFKALQPFVLHYELPATTWNINGHQLSPNFFVTLTPADFNKKIKALKLYASQLKNNAGPISVHGVTVMAQTRGLQCGQKYAEAFFAKRVLL